MQKVSEVSLTLRNWTGLVRAESPLVKVNIYRISFIPKIAGVG